MYEDGVGVGVIDKPLHDEPLFVIVNVAGFGTISKDLTDVGSIQPVNTVVPTLTVNTVL